MNRVSSVLACLLVVLAGACAKPPTDKPRRIGVLLYTDHTAINACRDGFHEYVREHPEAFGQNPDVIQRNAAGDATRLATYAEYFSAEPFDVVMAFGTPCAKILAGRNRLNSVVFAAPPDARAAGILDDPEHPGGLITGITYAPPADRLVEAIALLKPGLTRFGILRNPAEQNSRLVVDAVEVEARKRGLEVVILSVNAPGEVDAAAAALVDRVEIILAPNDNTVAAGLDALLRHANERGIPVVSVDRGSVERGAVLAIGADYHDIGRMAGEMAAEILQGASPATLPVRQAAQASRVFMNEAVAGRLSLAIPEHLSRDALRVP